MESWGYYSFVGLLQYFPNVVMQVSFVFLDQQAPIKFFVLHICKKWVWAPCCAPNCHVIVKESQLLHYYALLCHCLNLASSLTSSSYEWSCIDLWIYLQACTYTYLWIFMWTRARMWSHHCMYLWTLLVNSHLHMHVDWDVCLC